MPLAAQSLQNFSSILPTSELNPSIASGGITPPSQNTISSAQSALNGLDARPKPQSVPQQSGGFWGDLARLAPTIGSVALPTIFDIATGGAGIPLDALLGGIGGAVGKGIENASQGQNPLSTSDLLAAAEGAGGQLAGGILSKGLGMAGNALSGMATNATTDAATQGAAQDAAQGILDKQATNDVNYAGLGSKLQQHLNFGSNQKLFDSLGIDSTNPTKLNQASKAGLFLNSKYVDALNNAGSPIDTSQFANDAFDSMKQNGVTDLSTSPLGKAISQSGIPTDELSRLPAKQITASEGRDLAQSINVQMRDLASKIDAANINGQTSAATDLENQYNTLKAIHDNLYKQIETPKVNSAISSIKTSPEELAALKQQYGDKLGQYVADQLDNADNASNLRKSMAPFAQTKDATNIANDFNANVTAGSAARNRAELEAKNTLKDAGVNATTSTKSGIKQLTNPKTLSELGGLYETVVNKKPDVGLPLLALGALSGNPSALSGVGGLLNGLGGESTDSMLGRVLSTIPGTIGGTIATSPNTVTSNPANTGANMNADFQNTPLATALNQELYAPYLYSGNSLSNLVKMATAVQGAERSAQNVANESQLAGVGQGPLMGLMSRLGQTLTGGPASLIPSQNVLGQQEAQASQALNAALAMAGGQAQPIPMPQVTQSGQSSQAAIQGIRNLLQALGGGQYAQAQ